MKIVRATIVKTTAFPELHYLAGTNVIVEDNKNNTVTIHFTEGTVRNMIVPRLILEFKLIPNSFNSYYYIYVNSHNKYRLATNPVFVASHRNCTAVPKSSVTDIGDYLKELNNEADTDTY